MLPLNNAHAKETSALDDASLTALLDMAFYARGIDRGATAFLIALAHNAPYESPNYLWFKAARESFVYIDRIIVLSSARGRGIARLLYNDLFAAARTAGHDRVVCEVNIDPPNLVSEAFHATMGFQRVGGGHHSQWDEDRTLSGKDATLTWSEYPRLPKMAGARLIQTS